jgi:hypothetical protein
MCEYIIWGPVRGKVMTIITPGEPHHLAPQAVRVALICNHIHSPFQFIPIVMKYHSLALSTLLIRFYLMMLVVIVPFFIGIPWLAALSIPIFFSALMGVKFNRSTFRSKQAARQAPRPDSSAHSQTQTSY